MYELDPYEVLGVSRSASVDEIRIAYRKLARTHHPDVSTEADAHMKFIEVQEAYENLSDAEKRAAIEVRRGPTDLAGMDKKNSWESFWDDMGTLGGCVIVCGTLLLLIVGGLFVGWMMSESTTNVRVAIAVVNLLAAVFLLMGIWKFFTYTWRK